LLGGSEVSSGLYSEVDLDPPLHPRPHAGNEIAADAEEIARQLLLEAAQATDSRVAVGGKLSRPVGDVVHGTSPAILVDAAFAGRRAHRPRAIAAGGGVDANAPGAAASAAAGNVRKYRAALVAVPRDAVEAVLLVDRAIPAVAGPGCDRTGRRSAV